ncbi:hypothetical protein ACLKA7_000394 [Drosophila subpalustris]
MQNSRNIIKRFALSRCPPPAFGKMPARESIGQAGSILAHARLANCCRKLYTRLFGWGQKAGLGQALATRRRKYDMTWLKIALRLKKSDNDIDAGVVDALSMPLKQCLDLQPYSICAPCKPDLSRQYGGNIRRIKMSYKPKASYFKRVRTQSLVVKAKHVKYAS